MITFAKTVQQFWYSPFPEDAVVYQDPAFTVLSDPSLSHDRRVTLLDNGSRTQVIVAPELAQMIDISADHQSAETAFRESLRTAGITLHDPDFIYYFSEEANASLLAEPASANIRRLTEEDRVAFSAFEAAASAQDLDDAYVELEHWAVFGAFDGEALVCVASMYPWGDTEFADLGVLTLPEHRGHGYATQVVREICRYAFSQGYEPQYRCQVDNDPSKKLAVAAGLSWFGRWEVVSPDSGR